jgi:E3 ubiquitin-protein ligase HERC2
MNSTDDRPWRANFAGEGSIDAGGPFRDSVSNICKELESDVLPLLIQTVNTRNNHGEYRDCYLPNPSSNSPTHLELFKFLGHLLGFGIRSLSPMNLHFPPIIWKQILGEPLTYNDLKGIDQYSWKCLENLKVDAKKLSNEEFEATVQQNFTTYLSNKVEVELKRGGAQI